MQGFAFDKSVSEDPDLHFVNPVSSGSSGNQNKFGDIIGQSDGMQEIFRLIEKVADSDSTIIISGETGTGKGLVSKAIHQNSNRKDKPFIQINCGAIPENLLESELFGHVRGAFTGATSDKPGKFERANGGTIFLDEIGDMSPDLQVKVDVRIIAATHRDLEEEVQKGTFREDLFYRLHVIPVNLPPLRERKSDIPILIAHFLEQFNRMKNKQAEGVSDEAMEVTVRYSWPGNVRELKNMVERLVVLNGEGKIEALDLPEKLRRRNGQITPPSMEISHDGICLNTAVNEFEKALIVQSLVKTNWVKNKAAKLLHLNRTTLVEKIKRHNLYELQQSS